MSNPKHPVLGSMIHELSLDNHGSLEYELSEDQWRWPEEAPVLEQMAKSLTEEERSILVSGEQTEQLEVVARCNVYDLHYFLDEVFDGILRANFYQE